MFATLCKRLARRSIRYVHLSLLHEPQLGNTWSTCSPPLSNPPVLKGGCTTPSGRSFPSSSSSSSPSSSPFPSSHLPTFEDIVRRQTVLAQYRAFCRVSSRITDPSERRKVMADVGRSSTVGGGEQMEGADFNFRYNLGKREPTALERVVGYTRFAFCQPVHLLLFLSSFCLMMRPSSAPRLTLPPLPFPPLPSPPHKRWRSPITPPPAPSSFASPF